MPTLYHPDTYEPLEMPVGVLLTPYLNRGFLTELPQFMKELIGFNGDSNVDPDHIAFAKTQAEETEQPKRKAGGRRKA